jgi:hypothetical protein
MRLLSTILTAAWAVAVLHSQSSQVREAFAGMLHEHPAIAYEATEPADPVGVVNQRLAGSALWTFDPVRGYLRNALAALDVPLESQVLLFSKTALQQRYTSPATPRAFYFNDSVVVGYIPGAPMMEIAGQDPRQGAVFYRLAQDPAQPPRFERRTECLTCHISSNTMDVPGFIARSMFAGVDGQSYPQLGSALVDHRTPYGERWGGWFVTGAPPALAHLGNQMVGDPPVAPKPAATPLPSLEGRLAAGRLLSPHSDVTALLVFDHQMRAANLLTRLAWETRVARTSGPPDFSTAPLANILREVADYLVFVDEPSLPGPIDRGAGFAEVFAARGPFDQKGRSLREFDRRTRLFRYPASYMVYSPVFAALPPEARGALLERMRAILEGAVADTKYARLPSPERKVALELIEEVR